MRHITMFDEVGTAGYALDQLGRGTGWLIARPKVAVEAGPPTDQLGEVFGAIGRLQPERFIIDVQRGMASPRWDEWRESLTTTLDGYSVRAEVINANEHRAAYLHKRLFFVGSRVDELPRGPRRRRPLAIADVLRDRDDLPDWAYVEPLRVPRTAISTDCYAFPGRKPGPPLVTTHAERMAVLGLPRYWVAPSFASFADATPVQSYAAVLEANR